MARGMCGDALVTHMTGAHTLRCAGALVGAGAGSQRLYAFELGLGIQHRWGELLDQLAVTVYRRIQRETSRHPAVMTPR